MRRLVGVIGAGGAVGRAHVRQLRECGIADLRLGSRCPSGAGLAECESIAVDINEGASLERFCGDCQVVVNCAGPSCSIMDRVARAAFATGAGYVDPGGDEGLAALLSPASDGWRAILSAGMMPGATGLVPRWLATQGFDRVERLTAYISVRDFFTAASALDYLFSIRSGYGEALAGWRRGAKVARLLQPLSDLELAAFGGRVRAYPYFTQEAGRAAAKLGLQEVSWYIIFDGPHVLNVIARVQQDAQEPDQAMARELSRAAELDLFGRAPCQIFQFRMEGQAGGRPLIRTAVMRSADTSEVTAAVASSAVLSLLAGDAPEGVHYAADVLDPARTLEFLSRSAAVTSVETREAGEVELEEGSF